MANPAGPGGFGFLGYLQFARDATWGTFPTINHRIPFYSASARSLAKRIRPNLLDGTLYRNSLVVGVEAGEMDVKLPVTYSGMLLIWDALFGTGTYASNGGSTSGSNPYTHIWGTQRLMNSLSFELIQGNIPASQCVRLTSGKIQRAAFKWSGGLDSDEQIGTVELKIVGKSYTKAQTPTGSLSSLALDFVMAQHMTVNTDPASVSTAAITEELEIVIETMATPREFMEGSGFITEPQRNGRPKLTVSMTKQFQVGTWLNAYISNTHGAGQVNFTSGSLQWQLDYSGALSVFPENEESDEGWIKQRIVIEDAGDTSQPSLTVVNAQALITT